LTFCSPWVNSTRNLLQRFKSREIVASRNHLSRLIVDDPRRSNFCTTKIGSIRKVANALREERNYGAGRRISMRRRRNWPGSLNAISWRITMEIRILAAREYTYVRHSRAGHGASTVRRDSNVISFHITREPNLASTILPHGTENGSRFRFTTRSEFQPSRRDANQISYLNDNVPFRTQHDFRFHESNAFLQFNLVSTQSEFIFKLIFTHSVIMTHDIVYYLFLRHINQSGK